MTRWGSALIAALFAFAVAAQAADREQYSVTELSVGTVQPLDGSLSITGATMVATTLTSPTITGGSVTGQSSSNLTVRGSQSLIPVDLFLTNNAIIPATSALYHLRAATAVTVTVANASVAGQYLELVGVSNLNVFVLDSGNWEGAATIGAEDVHAARAKATGQWITLFSKDNTP